MGLVYADIDLKNPREPQLAGLKVSALVDTGAVHLCIPEHVALQLDLQENQKREVEFADGRRQLCSYVGPLEINFAGRKCFTGAVVVGDTVLLGAIPMEDMDLIVHPARQMLIPNPANPNVPVSLVK